jgi:hypothetical protein
VISRQSAIWYVLRTMFVFVPRMRHPDERRHHARYRKDSLGAHILIVKM